MFAFIYKHIFIIDDHRLDVQKIVENNVQPFLTKHSISFPNKITEMEIEDDGTMIYSKAQEDLISENLFKQL